VVGESLPLFGGKGGKDLDIIKRSPGLRVSDPCHATTLRRHALSFIALDQIGKGRGAMFPLVQTKAVRRVGPGRSRAIGRARPNAKAQRTTSYQCSPVIFGCDKLSRIGIVSANERVLIAVGYRDECGDGTRSKVIKLHNLNMLDQLLGFLPLRQFLQLSN
jgi:hypothetical protein